MAPDKTAQEPSLDQWLREAKADPKAAECGMFLCHNGVVRITPKAQVREGVQDLPPVVAIDFSYDKTGVANAITQTMAMPGIGYVRVWLAEGRLEVGDSIMYVLVGGDIRPHVIDALQELVGTIKSTCVTETEIYEEA